MNPHRLTSYAALAAFALGFAAPSRAAELPGTQTLASPHDFAVLVTKLEAAVTEHKMAVVAKASASQSAAARGVNIP
jgi:hypothetical protein